MYVISSVGLRIFGVLICGRAQLHDKGQWDREAAVLRESAATLERQVKLADRQVEEMTAELTRKVCFLLHTCSSVVL